MDDLNLALLVVGLLVLAMGLIARPLDRSWLSAPLVALAVGILLGPAVAGALDPSRWGDSHTILQEAARLALGISLMGIALRLPQRFIQQHWRAMAALLLLAMPLMFLVSAGLSWWLLGVTPLVALLIGACVCPTDPVVASTVVTGELAGQTLPARFRHLLSAESGANDGLAYPLVFLPILLLTRPAGDVWSHWFLHVWVYEVGGAVVFGLLLGWVVGKGLRWAEARDTMGRSSFLAATLALTIAALGGAKLLGTDGLLAVFVAGIAFDQLVGGAERAEEDNVQEAVNLFFTLPVFTLFGLMLPWQEWQALGWAGIALAFAVLMLRRLPILLLMAPLLRPWRDTHTLLLAGWFGPIGVSALFYTMEVAAKTGDTTAWHAGSLIVMASLIAHGMTAAPLARRHARRHAGERARHVKKLSG